MPKKSKKLGKNTLVLARIQNISQEGIWILIDQREFFMSFAKFPWFLKASIEQVYNLELLNSTHLYWPNLDIDIALDSLINPAAYPLQYS